MTVRPAVAWVGAGSTGPVGVAVCRDRLGWWSAGVLRRAALVGSHEEVADRITEYHALGVDEFILSGYPHLEEAWWVGEGVLPVLQRRGLWAPPDDRHEPGSRNAAFAAFHGSR